jgi:anti-sigma B factor antagonist
MEIIEATLEGGLAHIAVKAKRLDAASSAEFKSACEKFWTPGISALEVDLAETEFIDSSGIGALLSLYKRLPPPNANVRLLRVRPPVQAVIDLLRLNRIFEVVA